MPSSLRSVPLTVSIKALSPCFETGMSKDVLPPATFFWEFLDINNHTNTIDPNDWQQGTILVIPRDVLSDQDIFPPNVAVALRVAADFGQGVTFFSDVIFEFLSSPIQMVVQDSYNSVVDADDTFVIDFSGNSFFVD